VPVHALCFNILVQILFCATASPPPPSPVSQDLTFTRFLDHTQRRTAVGRTPLDEGSARRRDLYLTTHNTHNTSMPPVEFEPTISTGERPQTYALDRAAAGTGCLCRLHFLIWRYVYSHVTSGEHRAQDNCNVKFAFGQLYRFLPT